MIRFYQDNSLRRRHTFGIDVNCKYLFEYDSIVNLKEILKTPLCKANEMLLLGGGSNLLFLSDFDGVVLHSLISGIEVVDRDADSVIVRAGAGVEWDRLVEWCVDKGFGGIENLSYIPGDVGAAPVQNIGAYGVEFNDVFVKCDAILIEDGREVCFGKEECGFDYRNSIFKQELKNKAIITFVYIKLQLKPVFKLDYGNVKTALKGYGEASLSNIRKAIIEIRRTKLPDPAKFGNAGSFFKNPIVDIELLKNIQKEYDDVPFYESSDKAKVKIPAAWMIDKLGWKGRVSGKAAVHKDQALVLINLGGASGTEIYQLSQSIERDVKDKFDISLEREVSLI
jgi:UDP-N-acetylmuramate dehydrogenase